MRIIPAIDIIEGKCVRLSKGDYATQKVYNEDPLEVAKMYEDYGVKFLHLVDLDGAKGGHIINWKVLEKIAIRTKLTIDFGGGIKSDEDIEIAFNSGADQITGGSIAVKDRQTFTSWITKYGRDKIILGADVKDRKVFISGWLEESILELTDFISDYRKKGIDYVICTDISKDGMLQGSSKELYKELIERFPKIRLIASGGVTTINEVQELSELGLDGAIIGKAIYEGHIKMEDLKKFL